MKSTANHIAKLILKKMSGELSVEESALLEQWRNVSDANRAKYEELVRPHFIRREFISYTSAEMFAENIRVPAIEEKFSEEKVQTIVPSHRIHFLRRGWFRYAAAVILVAGAVTAIVISNRPSNPSQKSVVVSQADILPGTNKAMLTVDDKKINLSSDKSGITVGADIAYMDGEKLSDAGKMLMLTTPNGGQYQLLLPDGTKAWLNAASSISFPSAFNGEKRQIKITGEVYLEVAKDKSRPFFVDVDGQSTVEVLGTSFNINSYADDDNIQTTLVDGSVSVDQKIILKRGEQALKPLYTTEVTRSSDRQSKRTDDANKITVVSNIDLSQTLAWKNGLFNFSNANLRSAMRQLERWYDIKVQYEGNVPDINLDGEIYRNLSLSDVLEPLSKMGLKFKREGKTLIVFK